ncbi:peptidoglycan-binding protein, partial [Candidatus Wolfebacteria bacterium]|nr:peptidoglycan-binding protein [Candidatus Wolfebacteria bacterium]
YPSEAKYIVLPFDIDPGIIGDVEINIADTRWSSKQDFEKPDTQIRDIKTQTPDTKEAGASIKGFITNNNAFELRRVNIIGFLFNKTGSQISASKTQLENLRAFEEKSFEISFPSNIDILRPAPTPLAAPYIFKNDLIINKSTSTDLINSSQANASSTDVDLKKDTTELHKFLQKKGFYQGEITDVFNSETEWALMKFQEKYGISPADGIFNEKTREVINKMQNPPKQPVQRPNYYEADPSKTKVYAEALR